MYDGPDTELFDKARAYVEEVWEDVVADIDYLVQVDSVENKSAAAPGMPFGPGPHAALTRALEIATRLGLHSHDCEGYIGYADLVGEKSDTYLATIAHADIVPVGEGWSTDPLRVTRKGGYLLGRGVLDDKGPLVLSLYAAHYFARLQQQGAARLPYTLRCLVGSNEETNMADVEYYLEHYPQPAFCFTPDAMFPLICGEKGCLHATVSWTGASAPDARIVEMTGGTVPNAIPRSATAIVRAAASELSECEGIRVRDAGTDAQGRPQARIEATGIGGHASMPEGTRNAIGMLVDYLADEGLFGESEQAFLDFERILLADSAGEALGIAATDDLFDPLTCVGGTVCTKREGARLRFEQSIDIRYPKSTDEKAIMDTICRVAEKRGCVAELDSCMVPFFLSPDSFEVRALVDTYNQVTGNNREAFTIGGGTYARHFERAAAFGPDDMDAVKPDWVGIEHGPDEGVAEAALQQALVIYIVAIARLMRIEYLSS